MEFLFPNRKKEQHSTNQTSEAHRHKDNPHHHSKLLPTLPIGFTRKKKPCCDSYGHYQLFWAYLV